MDRLVKVVAHDGTATLYEYDANGNRTAVRYANGMIVKYEYDTVNRLVLEKALDKDANVVVQYSYTLGAAGERTKVVETGETELKTVLKVFVHSVDEILHLYTDEGDIDTTTNHPFYVVGKGWTAAGNLVEGDEVYNLDGSTSVVLGAEIEKLDECVLVYNLEVEDFHSYFVGDVPVLVHNIYGSYKDMKGIDGTESHHIIQDAAVRDMPGYNRENAPAIPLEGKANTVGTNHYNATQYQNHNKYGGTYGEERKVAYMALIKAGKTPEEACTLIKYADSYFIDKLGWSMDTILRIPGNRR